MADWRGTANTPKGDKIMPPKQPIEPLGEPSDYDTSHLHINRLYERCDRLLEIIQQQSKPPQIQFMQPEPWDKPRPMNSDDWIRERKLWAELSNLQNTSISNLHADRPIPFVVEDRIKQLTKLLMPFGR